MLASWILSMLAYCAAGLVQVVTASYIDWSIQQALILQFLIMSEGVKSRKYTLKSHFSGLPKREDLEIVEEELPQLKDGGADCL